MIDSLTSWDSVIPIFYAVKHDSVASAICAGALYAGGFGDRISFLQLLVIPRRSRPRTRAARALDECPNCEPAREKDPRDYAPLN